MHVLSRVEEQKSNNKGPEDGQCTVAISEQRRSYGSLASKRPSSRVGRIGSVRGRFRGVHSGLTGKVSALERYVHGEKQTRTCGALLRLHRGSHLDLVVRAEFVKACARGVFKCGRRAYAVIACVVHGSMPGMS
jgi:hypothetical protein